MRKRILILGNGGSGKSTLANKLKKKNKLPVLHLDSIYWENGFKHTNRELFLKAAADFCEKQAWVIEGTPMPGIETRIAMADTIVLLDVSSLTCLFRVIRRSLYHLLHHKPDLTGCPAITLNWKTVSWIASFNRKIRPKLMEAIKKNKHAELIRLRKNRDIVCFINQLSGGDG